MSMASTNEYGFLEGETLNDRPRRLDEDLVSCRANIGVHDEPQPTGVPFRQEHRTGLLFDEQLYPLALDSLACAHAILASFSARVPYGAAREVTRFAEGEEAQLAEMQQQVAIKHAAFFAEQRELVELGVALVAIPASQLDQLLAVAATDEPLTGRQCFGGLLFVLAPLLVLLVIHGLSLLVAKVRR